MTNLSIVLGWIWICGCWREEILVNDDCWFVRISVLIGWWLTVIICGCWSVVDGDKNVRCKNESDGWIIVCVTGWICCWPVRRLVFDEGETVATIGRIPVIL